MRIVRPVVIFCSCLLALLVAGCSDTRFEPPQVLGTPALVGDKDAPRLWVFTKQEEIREIRTGGSRRTSGSVRRQTFFHFDLQAFDPATARPVWTQRLLTLTDKTHVSGSSADGRLLGQDGDVVWLVMDDKPLALNVADGTVAADAAALETRNPDLQGLLPGEGKHYSFDRGLVMMAADGRQLVIRAPDLEAKPYTPTPPPVVEGERYSDGTPRLAPLVPFGEVPARQVTLGGQWLGLYTEKEAADAATDDWGQHLQYPYTVLDEGAMARRGFWRGTIVSTQRFDDRFDRIESLAPLAGAPVFLKGRFLKDYATGQPLLLEQPAGVAVWHSTRVDREGRLALTRLDADLRKLWTSELPVSENTISTPVRVWALPGRLLAVGVAEVEVDGVVSREPHIVSIALADGAVQAWSIDKAAPLP